MDSAPTQNNSLTQSQQEAVRARGNVLVMAGAGTGKTHTLIQRCLDCLCREWASLEEILVVTFTEAAATEMKGRLRTALEAALDTRQPALDTHLAEQLALFDTAPIGTLHSFCLRLVREHFYELGLDPQMNVLDTAEASLLAGETLDEQFQSHYAGQAAFSVPVQNLIRIYGNGDERPVRAMLLRLHHYSQTRPDAGRWLAGQLARFASPEPVEWRKWLDQAIDEWQNDWLPVLENLKSQNEKAAELLKIVEQAREAAFRPGKAGVAPDLLFHQGVRRNAERGRPEACSTRIYNENTIKIFGDILAADENYPSRKKTALREPLKEFFADTAFLQSLLPTEGSREPLAEDWDWVRGHMAALLKLTQEFGEKFAERKRADGVLDFHDLEQFALKLLWNFDADQPTAIAERGRQKIRFVFVDEYQDINAAQDNIIRALSRENAASNRFLVGDVKQSIYRFRLADPGIFRDYAKRWTGDMGRVLPLTENFRSREGLLAFVNSVFEQIMREEIGGVAYDSQARLQFGLPEKRAFLRLIEGAPPRAELLLRFKGNSDGTIGNDPGDNGVAELAETEKEARLVAYRLRELIAQGHKVWDEESHVERLAEWRDMSVLLRAPANKAEVYAREFERAGVPLVVVRGGFYDSAEIADLLNLLKLLDNPLQDIPAIAVLRSPLAGLSLDELAEIRLAAKNVRFWTALNRRRHANLKKQEALDQKIGKFLDQFSRWRQLARQVSLSQCLETVLAETGYAEWLQSHPRGAQRHANLECFINLAQKFDQFQRQGLFRFLKFVEAQRATDAEPEVAAAAEENGVRMMSIHQSKGLEFPIVVVADLAKPFNEQDLRGEIIFDEQLGLCPRIKPPHTSQRYPSLPHWMARRRQRREQRGEELRLLYVAMTRARDTLVLTATLSEIQWKTMWLKPKETTARDIAGAKSYANWMATWFGANNPESTVKGSTRGELPHLRWRIVGDDELAAESGDTTAPATGIPEVDNATANRLRKTLSWDYPYEPATKRPAKSSVTALRRQAEELDDESEQMFSSRALVPRTGTSRGKLPATRTGIAHHKLLEHIPLATADDADAVAAEADRLKTAGILSADERAALDCKAVAAFWNSKVGRQIRAQSPDCIKRELPFTARFSPEELGRVVGTGTTPGLEGEFVVVQGVADLVVLLPEEIWVVDFKTDEIAAGETARRELIYRTQLKLYADALSRIYSRRVTNRWLHFLAAQKTVRIKI